jgi:hypothetical protein
MISIFKKLDYLGQPIGFEYDNSTTYKTIQGAFFTLIVTVLVSIIGFIFGQEIYQRKDPIVRYAKSLEKVSSVNVNDYPILIGINFKNGSLVKNIDEFMEPFFFYGETSSEFKSTSYFRSIGPCTSANFTSFRAEFTNLTCDNGGCFCVDPRENASYQNKFMSANSSIVHIGFRPCDSTNRKCNPAMDELMKNFIFFAMTVNFYVDPGNYENPVKYFIDTHAIQSSIDFYKRGYISISNHIFISDNGWMFEDLNIIKYTQVSSFKSDILKYSPGNTPLVAVTFDSPNLIDSYNRSYIKVQDLFAKIGGLINAAFIIMYLLTFNYLRYIYLIEIAKKSANDIDKSLVLNNNQSKIKVDISRFVDKSKLQIMNNEPNNQNYNPINEQPKDNKIINQQVKNSQIIESSIINKKSEDSKILSYYYYFFPCFNPENKIKIKSKLDLVKKKISFDTFISILNSSYDIYENQLKNA